MSSIERLHQKRKELQEHFNLLSEKIPKLRKAHGIETNPEVKLSLEKQLEQAEVERESIEKQLASLEIQIRQVSKTNNTSLIPSKSQGKQKEKIQVFLSYVKEDQYFVEELYQKLHEAGFQPWMASKSLIGGQLWKNTIQQAIRDADFFIVCLSENSVVKRSFFDTEIQEALNIWSVERRHNIFLIPSRFDNCNVPEELKDLHWVNLFEEDGFDRLLQTIQIGIKNQKQAKQSDKISFSIVTKIAILLLIIASIFLSRLIFTDSFHNMLKIFPKTKESHNETRIIPTPIVEPMPLINGLKEIDTPVGTFIAYATAPMSVVYDISIGNRNGVFTKHLLNALQIKDISIEQMFKKISVNVNEETKGRQNPWFSSSLKKDFYFNPSSTTSLLENRKALVIGNNDYQSSLQTSLQNSVNDAEDMAIVLSSLGFSVIKKINVNRQDMEKGIEEFVSNIQHNNILLFYFSGMGFEIAGEDYLLPVEKDVLSKDNIKYNTINVIRILKGMEVSESQANIIIVDTCRNNPYR